MDLRMHLTQISLPECLCHNRTRCYKSPAGERTSAMEEARCVVSDEDPDEIQQSLTYIFSQVSSMLLFPSATTVCNV